MVNDIEFKNYFWKVIKSTVIYIRINLKIKILSMYAYT